jgi:hypothetical protein
VFFALGRPMLAAVQGNEEPNAYLAGASRH